MQRLVDQFDDPAYVVSFEGNVGSVLSWNRPVERALGRAAEDAIGHGIDEVLRGIIDARSRLRRIVEMRRRGSWHGRTVLQNRRGVPVAFQGGCIRLVGGTDYLTVLRFRPIEFSISLREFAESGAQSERCSVGERQPACNGDGEMTDAAKQQYGLELNTEPRNLQRKALAGPCMSGYPDRGERAYVQAVASMSQSNTVGARLTAKREQADYSKRALARKAGVSEWQIRAWENNVHEPSARNLMRLIPYIGGTVEYYLTGGGDR